MHRVAVLVIEEGGAEAALLRAALARCEARVVESPGDREPIALAIAGAKALTQPDEILKTLRGVPVVGIAPRLAQKAKKRALAAGVREIHERPREWRRYAELVESLVARFTRRDSPPHRGPTS